MNYRYTHIWDITEYSWFLGHKDMMFTVPVCAEFYNATRESKIPILVMPEAMLIRGTGQTVHCPVCNYLNMQIKQGTIQNPDIWEDLAEGPQQEKI